MDRRDDLVIVTGGSSGIGAAAAVTLVEAGFRPLVVDINVLPSDRRDSRILYWETPLDVGDETSVASGMAEIESRFGVAFGLVNAAGILGKMHLPARVRMANWDKEMSVDLRGTFLSCRAVGERMASCGRGSIVNVASITGSTAAPALAYAAAKAGVINLTASLACVWGTNGVRVNAVSPGFTRTPALEAALEAGVMSESTLAQAAALKRLVDPTEVGRAIAWLIGSGSSGITGVNLPVDAGVLANATWSIYDAKLV